MQQNVGLGQSDAHLDDRRSGSPFRGASALLRPVATRGLVARMIVAGGLLALIIGGAFAVLLVAVADERAALDLSQHTERVLVSARALEGLRPPRRRRLGWWRGELPRAVDRRPGCAPGRWP
jgi:hypothetical protein